MRNFFKWAIKLGLRIIIIGLIIWILFFSLKYFFPQSFNFMKNRVNQDKELPFRYRVYNFLFKGNGGKTDIFDFLKRPKNNNNFYEQGSRVWGEDSTTTRDKNKLNSEDNYVYLNDSGSEVSNNFKFDDELISGEDINDLNPTTTITGEISLNYLSTPYYYVYLYDKEGNYLYSLLGTGQIDTENNTILVEIKQNLNFNYNNYYGEGFLVIWPDNDEVDSILISKINIIPLEVASTSDIN